MYRTKRFQVCLRIKTKHQGMISIQTKKLGFLMRLELTNNVRHYSDRVQVIADDKIRNKTIFGAGLYIVCIKLHY